MAREHPVEHGPEAEQVRPEIDRLAPGLLGRHERGRSQQLAVLGEPRVDAVVPGEAEVENLDPARAGFQPEVAGLDVAVDQALLVGRDQAAEDVLRHLDHGERRRPFRLGLQPGGQRGALEQLHRQERQALRLADLVDRYDVVALERGHGAGFAEEPLAGLGVGGGLATHHLQADEALQPGVFRQENDPHTPVPQQPKHAVTAQPAQFVRGFGGVEERERRAVGIRQLAPDVGAGQARILLLFRGRAGVRIRHSSLPAELATISQPNPIHTP
ncbi:MAG: hypothetical protein U0800_25025 [Isosphaeraceae bacterium]